MVITTIFLVIPIIVVTVCIFKVPTQDGYELIASSKPISRSQIFWAKVIVVLSYIIVISSVACCVSIGTQWSIFDISGIYKSLILGSFVGTFINSFFWFSVTLVVSFFISKMLTMFFVIGSKFILVLLSVILSVTSSSNAMQCGEIDHYRMNSISFMSNIDSNNEAEYFRGAVTDTMMGVPVVKEMKVFGKIAFKHLVNDFSNFNSNFWGRYDKENHQILTNSMDLDFQLSNFFNYYSTSLWDSYDWQRINQVLHWDKNVGRNFIYKFSPLNLEKLKKYDGFKRVKLDLDKKNNVFVGSEYFLQNYSFSMFRFPHTDKTITSKPCLKNNREGVAKLDVNTHEIYIPIIEIRNNNYSWKLQKFDNLINFSNHLYSDNIYSFLNKCFKNFNHEKLRLNYLYFPGVYYSIFSSYLYNNFNFNFNSGKSLKEFVNSLTTWIMQFQYWNWLLLQDMNLNPRNYPNDLWTPAVLRMIISMLSNGVEEYTRRNNYELWATIFVGNCKDFYDKLTSLSIEINNDASHWFSYRPPLSFLNENILDTLSYYELQPWTNMDYSFIVWFSISSILTLVGLRLYSRKDLL